MEIREYTDADKTAVVPLMASLQDFERVLSQDRPPGRDVAEKHFHYLLDQCRRNRGKVLVADDDGEVVGFIIVMLDQLDENDEHVYPEYKHYGLITDLIVKTPARGKGIGARLMQAAEKYCESLDVKTVQVSALHGNESARRLYKKSGYDEYLVTFSKPIGK